MVRSEPSLLLRGRNEANRTLRHETTFEFSQKSYASNVAALLTHARTNVFDTTISISSNSRVLTTKLPSHIRTTVHSVTHDSDHGRAHGSPTITPSAFSEAMHLGTMLDPIEGCDVASPDCSSDWHEIWPCWWANSTVGTEHQRCAFLCRSWSTWVVRALVCELSRFHKVRFCEPSCSMRTRSAFFCEA